MRSLMSIHLIDFKFGAVGGITSNSLSFSYVKNEYLPGEDELEIYTFNTMIFCLSVHDVSDFGQLWFRRYCRPKSAE